MFVSRESDNDNGGLWLVSHQTTLASDWLMGVISSPGWIWVIFCLLGRGWGLVLTIITLTYHRFYISSSHLGFSWKYKSLICCAKSSLVLLAVMDPSCFGPIRLRCGVWGVSERRVSRRVNANFKQNVIIILYWYSILRRVYKPRLSLLTQNDIFYKANTIRQNLKFISCFILSRYLPSPSPACWKLTRGERAENAPKHSPY